MAYIGRQLARGENKLFDDISSSFNGSATTFTLAVSSVATATATPYQLFVSLGGVMQKPNTDFTTAGNQITFTTAPAAGLSCWIMMQGDTIDQAAIPDASVTPSKISGTNFAFSGDLRLKDADGSHYVGFASPSTVSTNKVWTLPAADGSNGDFLKTNGSAVLSWGSVDTSTLMPLAGGIFTGDVTFDGATAGYDIVWDKSDNALKWEDNAKAKFGTGGDLQIFHNGSNSIINDAGTGNLHFQVGSSTKLNLSATGVAITGALTVSTNATITGNLTVSGTTTTVDSVTLSVKDKNIEMGVVSSPSDTTADGGGITLKGASDKTFNWVNATDAWTSSEHIHLLDNKKLFVGGASGTTDGLEIYHDGINSYLKDAGTGVLRIASNQIQVTNAIANEVQANFIENGAVELYHDNSKKFETTSSGINVTGAINVNGSALSVSPSVTANADGAIGAGDAVEIQANGTVKKIAATVTEQGAPTLDISKSVVDSGATVHNTMAISPEGINLNFYRDSDNSNYPTVRAAKINTAGNGFDLGTEITVNSASSTVQDVIYLTTNNGNPIFACCWSSASHTYLVAVMVNATTLACTYTSTNFYGVIQHGKMATFGSGTVFCVAGSIYNQAYLYRLYSYNNSAATVGALTNTQAGIGGTSPTGSGNGFVNNNSLLYDPDAQRLFHFCKYAGGNDKGYTIELDIVGQTTIASGDIGTPSAWNNNMSGSNMLKEEHVNSCYDTENNRAIIVFTDPHEGKCMAMAGPISTAGDGSKTYAWGTPLEVDSNQCSNVQVIFDPNIKKAVVNRNDEGGSDNLRWNILTLNTSNNTLTLGTEFSPGYQQGSNSGKNSTAYDVTRDVIVRSFKDKSNNNAALFAVKTSATTTTAERLLGFNQAAVTNGNAATIDIVGATNENQSSLTVGSKYYVQKNGTIATTADTPSVEAGIAVAATKLVVKG